MALLRSKGVREILSWTGLGAWNDPNWDEHWMQTNDIVEQVWGSDLSAVLITQGTAVQSSDMRSSLERSDWAWDFDDTESVLAVEAVVVEEATHLASVVVDFETSYSCPETRFLEVVVDARLAGRPGDSASCVMAVDLFNWTSEAWDEIDLAAPESDAWINRFDAASEAWRYEPLTMAPPPTLGVDRQALHFTDVNGRHHVGPDGGVRVRVRCEGTEAFSLHLDTVQVVEADEPLPGMTCPEDCAGGGDGQVDVGDLVAVINHWGGGAGPCDITDECGDGRTNVSDLLDVILNWGPCD